MGTSAAPGGKEGLQGAEGQRRAPRRRALLGAVLSCLLPGLGQLALGRRWRGAVMLLVTAGCLLAAADLWRRRDLLPTLVVQPGWLLAMLGVDAALLAFRAFAVVDAYRLGAARHPAPRRRAAGAALALILLVTAAPHAAAGYYDLQLYKLVTGVFPSPEEVVRQAVGGGDSERDGSATKTPGRLTVLLVGGDAGPGRSGLRTDAIIVASVDLGTGRAVLFGLPRNLVRVPLPEPAASAFPCRCFPRPLNELYAFAEANPQLFPAAQHRGVTALKGAAEQLLGLPIDHYVLLDLRGFVEVVDLLGGVDVTVTEPVLIEIDRLGQGAGTTYRLQPGPHHLDGLTALAYVRARKESDDYHRMQRQRCLLASLAQRANASRLLRALPRLTRAIERNVVTDVPADLLPTLVTLARGRAQVTSVGFTPPDYVTGFADGYPVPDAPRIQAAVQSALRPPEAAPAQRRPAPSITQRAGPAPRATAQPAQAPAQTQAQAQAPGRGGPPRVDTCRPGA